MVPNYCFFYTVCSLRPNQNRNTTHYGLVTHKLKKTGLKKHCSTVAFLILFISPLCSCCVPFVAKLTLRHLGVLVVGVDSFMLCERSLGSNPAQVTNYVEADFKGIEVNKKKKHKGSTKSVYQSIGLLFWINWAIFDIIHKK